MYIVVIENDGEKPSSKYYEDRRKMALVVRAVNNSKKLAPAARRHSGQEGRGAIIQEGCVITPSWSQAQAIAALARAEGIESVWIGTTELESYSPDAADQEAYNRIQEVFSRKGRPPQSQDWVVTCFEEMMSFSVESPQVALCPSCGGTNVRTRLGELLTVRDETDTAEDLLDFWLRSRFASGFYEMPKMSKAKGAKPAVMGNILMDAERLAVDGIRASKDFADLLNPCMAIKREVIMSLLDAAIGALCYTTPRVQSQARDRAVIAYMNNGGNPTAISIAPNKAAPDLLSLASVIGAEFVAALTGQMVRLRKDGAL